MTCFSHCLHFLYFLFIPFIPHSSSHASSSSVPPSVSTSPQVLRSHSAGSGSEPLCDLDGFSPPGLDMNAGHSDIPPRAHCDPLHASQSSLHDSVQIGRLERDRSLLTCAVCALHFYASIALEVSSIWNNPLYYIRKCHYCFLCFKRLDCEDYLCVQLLPGDAFQFASVIHITKAS